MRAQRKYNVVFRDIKSGNQRTVQVQTTDSLNAARLVYAGFGKTKIEVISAKLIEKV